MNKIYSKLKEIIDFFEFEEGYDKDEVILDILTEIKELRGIYADEIGLEWEGEILMILDDFVKNFYEKVIEKVCNVIKSYQNEK